jgi:uncharacterized membrane protein
MTAPSGLIAFAATLVAFLMLDFLWLATVGNSFYRPRMAYHLRPDVLFGVALAFYVLYAAALVYFAVRPGLADQSLMTAALTAAFFGLVAYGTYDLTNLSIMKEFPASLALLDMAWGTVLSAASASAGFTAARLFAGGS